ncbi:hypothetical protein KR032_003896, partial [Drosophila birchii]
GGGGGFGKGGGIEPTKTHCGAQGRESSNNSGRKMHTDNAKQHSSGIAIQAAKEAKKANDDMAQAVKMAADKIKIEYADKATAAANAADAVLFGKGQLLEQLEAEVCNARAMLEPEVQKLTTYEENDQLANKALEQSRRQVKGLGNSVKGAKEKLCTSEQLLQVWEKSVTEGFAVLEAAQKRVNLLMPILNEALHDREKTRKAAEVAAKSAEEAKNRIDQMEESKNRVDQKDDGSCLDSQERQ